MEKQVSIAEAKDHFSEIVQAAERGAVVTVTRRGKPVARLLAESNSSGFKFDREEANARR